MRHPPLLIADPLLPEAAVEEVLRFETPVSLIARIALEPIEVAGCTIPAGDVVQPSISSANRDAAHYPDSDRFDIRRKPANVLSFGRGPHGCLGAHPAHRTTTTEADI